MKQILIGISLVSLIGSAHAQTIVSGGEGSLSYVGDFTAPTAITQNSGTFTQTFLDTGWTSASSDWLIVSGQAVPDGAGNTNESMGIAFASAIDGNYTLSFDYKLTGGANNTGRVSGWALWGITDSTSFSTGISMDGNWTSDSVNTLTNSINLTRLLGEDFSNDPVESSYTGSIAQSFTANSTTYDGYLFLVNSASPGGLDGEFVDNVTIAVPEPSSFALLGGLLALGAVMTRRRQ